MKEQNNECVDVKKIMEEIKAEIREKGLINDIPQFSAVSMLSNYGSNYDSRLQKEIKYLSSKRINYDRELTSHKSTFKRIVIFTKRVIRKLFRFIGAPMVDEINEYNQRVARSIAYIDGYIRREEEGKKKSNEKDLLENREYRKTLDQYNNIITELEEKVEKCEQKMQALAMLEKEYECLRLEVNVLKLQLEKERLERKNMEN